MLGYKGVEFMDAGYVYAPYVPLGVEDVLPFEHLGTKGFTVPAQTNAFVSHVILYLDVSDVPNVEPRFIASAFLAGDGLGGRTNLLEYDDGHLYLLDENCRRTGQDISNLGNLGDVVAWIKETIASEINKWK